MNDLLNQFLTVRSQSEELCAPLLAEDYVVQPKEFVSPPKWHLGHSTWFFETFLLQHKPGYSVFDPHYNFVFNSYYESVGARVIRTDRGNLSRPSVADVYSYRKHVDLHLSEWLDQWTNEEPLRTLLMLGLNHEQQHQELLMTDIKYILGHNPLFPPYDLGYKDPEDFSSGAEAYIQIAEGLYDIGYADDGFCYDNEQGRHRVWLDGFTIAAQLVTNAAYLEFIEAGGYGDFRHWHAEGWDWVQKEQVKAPLYWHEIEGEWMEYGLSGLRKLDPEGLLCHVSFYEAAAFAAWRGMRLPTEQEWEVAALAFNWGRRWEWTNSAYLPYPGFCKAEGAIGEYNGKFMVNQMVLRGASDATPLGHSRVTYRNFFHASARWQYSGIRLVKQ
ncbi:ergothioneine biosynthesis protein EgtB [Sphingobacterium bambusae]|uniref:Ergothioneine biosynthesis protein EgtB n=1 Tax=Sphingobacterium bambusae TaxID=662858 RepID=A0ABW6BH96_9SPHI|nr:ergothioneine biosynthesis protein EgtB [Sphingobacterium bambusae]WPL49778.1 ergothioneine biosynthesis protein EgtB [Sphingobacterium bambusae]